MMNRKRVRGFAVLFALFLFCSSLAYAQGCAMCYTSVANSTQAQQAKTTLNSAILVLLLPAVTLFTGMFVLAYRYRNVFNTEEKPNSEKSRIKSDLAA